MNDEEEPLLKPSLARSRIFKLEGIFESFQYMAAKKELGREKTELSMSCTKSSATALTLEL